MDTTTLLIVAAFWILCGLAAGWLSSQRGNSASDGFLIGVLLGPLGLLMALTGKKTEPVEWAQPQGGAPPVQPPAPATFCPRCGTARAGGFRYCRACGLDFDVTRP